MSNKNGWPLETNHYRVDVQVPSGLASGDGVIELTAAWIPGTPFKLPIR